MGVIMKFGWDAVSELTTVGWLLAHCTSDFPINISYYLFCALIKVQFLTPILNYLSSLPQLYFHCHRGSNLRRKCIIIRNKTFSLQPRSLSTDCIKYSSAKIIKFSVSQAGEWSWTWSELKGQLFNCRFKKLLFDE